MTYQDSENRIVEVPDYGPDGRHSVKCHYVISSRESHTWHVERYTYDGVDIAEADLSPALIAEIWLRLPSEECGWTLRDPAAEVGDSMTYLVIVDRPAGEAHVADVPQHMWDSGFTYQDFAGRGNVVLETTDKAEAEREIADWTRRFAE